MAKRVTINMVAKHSGVSRGTVDRVLNGRPHVSPDIHERVVAAMIELGYRPAREEQAKLLGLGSLDLEPTKVGVILPDWGLFFQEEIMKGIEEARGFLAPYSIEVVINKCLSDLPEETVELLDDMLAESVRGIAICTNDNPAIIKKVNQLVDKGIRVVSFNTDLSESKRMCFVGQDSLSEGRVAGDLMSKLLDTEDSLLLVMGNRKYEGHRIRLYGFRERMLEQGFPLENQTIVETYNDKILTFQQVKKEMEANPNIKGIYMCNDDVVGCVEALRTMGKQGQIRIISHDLSEAAKRLLKTKEIDFTIAQDIRQQSFRSLMILKDSLRYKQSSEEKFSPTRIEIICAENI